VVEQQDAMALWLVTASWLDDEAELTQQWEVNVPTEHEAVREVTMLLPSKPHHVEAKLLAEGPATDPGPGRAKRLQ
jgi:hypothetical protein